MERKRWMRQDGETIDAYRKGVHGSIAGVTGVLQPGESMKITGVWLLCIICE